MPKSTARLKCPRPTPGKLRAAFHRLNAALLTAAMLLSAAPGQATMIETDDPELLRLAEEFPYGWLPRSLIPEELQDQIPEGCNGLYIELGAEKDSGKVVVLEDIEIIVEADRASVSDGSQAILEGNVTVSHGSRSISAEHMSYDRAIDKATLAGKVSIRQPGILIQGESADLSTTQHQASFNDARFVMKSTNVRGSAASVKQVNAYTVELHGGKMTSCEPGNESWVLTGEKITIDREKNQGTGRNVTLRVGDVPILYIPYISFPVGSERQTGLLFPSVSSSDDGGIDIALPYYLNLAPNYDATLTPRFITGRGTMLEVETRYLNRWMGSEVGLAFLPDDGGIRDRDLDRLIDEGEITEQEARPHLGENRWLGQLQQHGGSTEGWYTRIDYTRVSDKDYFRDLGTSSLAVASNTFLDQSAEVGYQFENWNLSALAHSQQTLLLDVEAPYRKLPQLNVNGRYNFNNLILTLNNQFTDFQERGDQPDILTGKRANTEYRLYWEKRYPWLFFKPGVGIKSLHYSLDEDAASGQTLEEFSLATPQATLDTGLVFEHRPGAFTQTFEPRLFYLFREYQDHSELFGFGADNNLNVNFDSSERTFAYDQLYRDSRFIGGDRLDDANQVTLGATTRWDNNATGNELFALSVGQIFHFSDRRVSLNDSINTENAQDSSEFAAEIKVNLARRTQFYANATYDTTARTVNRGAAGVNFASRDYQKLFNISYSYLRDRSGSLLQTLPSQDIDQLDISWAYPLAPQWAMMGHANYDFQNQQELETFAGFEYNDCCYRLRVLARRWLNSNIANLVTDEDAQYDQGLFFEVHFKGLGGSGAKVNSILNDGIFGYEQREKNLH